MPAILMIDRETCEIAKTNHFLDRGFAIAASHYSSPLMIEHRDSLISALTNCLHHPNNDVRVEAANALGRLGEEARPAVPALKEALDVRVIAVQEAALNALEKIAPKMLS